MAPSFDESADRVNLALADQEPISMLRFTARDLVTENVSKKVLHRIFLIELLRFEFSQLSSYEFANELRETLELLVLWTSRFHPEFPDPWRSGQPFDQTSEGKNSAIVEEAEEWLRSILDGS